MKLFNKYDDNEKNEIKKTYDLRIKNYCAEYCMLCKDKLKIYLIGGQREEIKKLDINIDNNIIGHFIWKKCQDNKVSSNFCLICGKKHIINEIEKNEENLNSSVKINKNTEEIKKNHNIKVENSNTLNNSTNKNNTINSKGINKEKREKDQTQHACCIIY